MHDCVCQDCALPAFIGNCVACNCISLHVARYNRPRLPLLRRYMLLSSLNSGPEDQRGDAPAMCTIITLRVTYKSVVNVEELEVERRFFSWFTE